jgi:putative spermidine/putrescine transport system permease protein
MKRTLLSERLRPYILLAPATTAILLLFVGGIAVGFGQSIGYMPSMGESTPTLRYYRQILADPGFYASLGLTLYIAFTATTLSIGVAVAVAMVLRNRFGGSRVATFFFQLPLPVPHLVAAAGIVMLVTQSGIFARVLYAVGALEQPSEFPVLVFDRGYIAAILVFMWKEIPFIGLVVLAVLKSIGVEYEEAAQTLGANAWQRFRYILLPLIMPSIISTSIIVFAFLFGSFEVPLLLGQRYPNTLSVTAYRAYIDPDLTRRPEAMAIGITITVIVIMLLALYRRLAAHLYAGSGS